MALVTLSEVKAANGIADTDRDAQITALLDPVSAMIEQYAGRSFTQASVTEYDEGGGEHLFLRRIPVASVTTIKDRLNDEVIDASDYELDSETGMVRRLPIGEMWEGPYQPSAFRHASDRILRRRWEVVYVGGPASAPEDVKLAVFQMVADRLSGMSGMQSESDGDYSYRREASAAGVPPAVAAILNRYRASPV